MLTLRVHVSVVIAPGSVGKSSRLEEFDLADAVSATRAQESQNAHTNHRSFFYHNN